MNHPHPASHHAAKTTAKPHEHGLAFVPITLFAIVMGMGGMTLATEKAAHFFHWTINPALFLQWLSAALFIIFVGLYGYKALRYPAQVKKDFRHPIRINFFPTISISLLLLSLAFNHTAPMAAVGLWGIGAALHLLFSLAIISVWMHYDKLQIMHLNPAWLIPAVGNIIVPLTGADFAPTELLWFYFSIGIFFGIILITLFFNRIIFHNPMPIKLMPTLFILLAPPTVGFLAYVKLTGEVDVFARILYYSAAFLFLLLTVQVRVFIKVPFFLSWWAYSFPLAATTLATFVMSQHLPDNNVLWYFAVLLYTVLLAVIILLLTLTLKAALKQQICINED